MKVNIGTSFERSRRPLACSHIGSDPERRICEPELHFFWFNLTELLLIDTARPSTDFSLDFTSTAGRSPATKPGLLLVWMSEPQLSSLGNCLFRNFFMSMLRTIARRSHDAAISSITKHWWYKTEHKAARVTAVAASPCIASGCRPLRQDPLPLPRAFSPLDADVGSTSHPQAFSTERVSSLRARSSLPPSLPLSPFSLPHPLFSFFFFSLSLSLYLDMSLYFSLSLWAVGS